jgi:hypothetical protein
VNVSSAGIVIVDLVNRREALAVDGITAATLEDDKGKRAFALGFWDRSEHAAKLMVGVFTPAGLAELKEEIDRLVAASEHA